MSKSEGNRCKSFNITPTDASGSRYSCDMTELAEWDSFYLIVGPTAGALIGLQFVVMTLLADRPRQPGIEVADTFATPTVIHFGVAFLLSAIIRVPWKTVSSVAAIWGIIGLIGVAYSVVVARRMTSQSAYKPVFEDWLFHVLLPSAAYATLAISAFTSPSYTHGALFGIGASTLLLLFIGIHNSWDTVTYNVFVDRGKTDVPTAKEESSPKRDESEQT